MLFPMVMKSIKENQIVRVLPAPNCVAILVQNIVMM